MSDLSERQLKVAVLALIKRSGRQCRHNIIVPSLPGRQSVIEEHLSMDFTDDDRARADRVFSGLASDGLIQKDFSIVMVS
ncbi:MAG: hypothetical protein KDB53_07760, partial [Planctomycetes bacterium]|nr:hypothetical protein [Planctomycetota bacterium]